MIDSSLGAVDPQDALEIQQVVAYCSHLLDSHQWDSLNEVFTEDVVFDVTDLRGPVVHGLDNLRAHFDSRNHPVAHHTTDLLIFMESGSTRARLHCKYLLPRDDGTVASGDYFDTAIKTPAGWRITSRRCTLRRQHSLPDTSRR